jgi:hypothetical protein
MSINKVTAGDNVPHEFNVIIEMGLDVAHAELLDGVRRYSAQDR